MAANLSGSVADLFGTLGLDTSGFNEKLAEAKIGMITAADDMALPLGKINALLDGLRLKISPTAASSLLTQLSAQGYSLADSVHLAYAAIAELEQENKKRAAEEKQALEIMAAREKEYTSLWKGLLHEREEAEAAAAARRVEIENNIVASVVRSAQLRQSYIKAELDAEVAAEAEAAAAKVAANRAAQESISGGAYLLGGYGAARAVRGAMSLAGPALGVVALAGTALALEHFTKQASEAALKTDNFANELGVSWEQARRLQEIAHIAGVEVNTLAQASGRLAVSMEGGSTAGKDIRKALEEIGVTGTTSGELLLNFVEHLSKIGDQTQRIEEGRRVIGRGSAEIVALATKLVEAKGLIEELGPSWKLNPKLIESEEHMTRLGVAWERLKSSMAETGVMKTVSDFLASTFNAIAQTPQQRQETADRAAIKQYEGQSPQERAAMSSVQLNNMENLVAKYRALDAVQSQLSAKQAAANAVLAQQERDREALRSKTLDGMKAQLQMEKEEIQLQDKVIFNRVKLATPQEAEAAQAARDAAEQRKNALEGKIKALEEAGRGKDYTADLERINAEIAHNRAVTQINQPIVPRRETRDSVSDARAYAKQQRDEIKAELDDTLAGIEAERRALASSGMISPLDRKTASTRLDSRETAAKDKSGLANRRVAQEEADAVANIEESQRRASLEGYKALQDGKIAEEHKFQEASSRIFEEIERDEERAGEIALTMRIAHNAAIFKLQREQVTFSQSQGLISVASKVGYLSTIDKAEEDAALADIDRQRRKIQSETTFNSRSAALLAELDHKEQEIQDRRRLRGEQEREELARGDSVSREIAQERLRRQDLTAMPDMSKRIFELVNMRVETDALRVVTRGLGGVYEDLAKSVEKGFGSIAHELGVAVFQGGKAGKELMTIAKRAAGDVVGTLIEDALKLGVGKIITVITHNGGVTAQVAEVVALKANTWATMNNTDQTVDNTAQVIENTDALLQNTRAIYELIKALQNSSTGGGGGGYGAAAGKGAVGGVAEGIGKVIGTILATAMFFDDGGDVPRTGLHVTHQGEHVLNKDISAGLKQMMARPGGLGGSSGGGTTLHIHNPQFTGHFTASEIDDIGNRLVKAARRTGGTA